MSNILRGSSVYLSGSMDKSPDKGFGWRDSLSPFLKNLGIKVMHPGRKPSNYAREDVLSVEERCHLKQQGRFQPVITHMKEVVAYDLRMVTLSDFVILYVTPDIHMCGSYWEATVAKLNHAPILTIVKDGLQNVPDWLLGALNFDEMFNSFEECKQYILDIDAGKPPKGKGWRFFHWADF